MSFFVYSFFFFFYSCDKVLIYATCHLPDTPLLSELKTQTKTWQSLRPTFKIAENYYLSPVVLSSRKVAL